MRENPVKFNTRNVKGSHIEVNRTGSLKNPSIIFPEKHSINDIATQNAIHHLQEEF